MLEDPAALYQVSLFVSEDLEDRVVRALRAAQVEGFARVPGVSANRFNEAPDMPRAMVWAASIFVVPVATREQLERIRAELIEFIETCDLPPCLRVTAHRLEAAF